MLVVVADPARIDPCCCKEPSTDAKFTRFELIGAAGIINWLASLKGRIRHQGSNCISTTTLFMLS